MRDHHRKKNWCWVSSLPSGTFGNLRSSAKLCPNPDSGREKISSDESQLKPWPTQTPRFHTTLPPFSSFPSDFIIIIKLSCSSDSCFVSGYFYQQCSTRSSIYSLLKLYNHSTYSAKNGFGNAAHWKCLLMFLLLASPISSNSQEILHPSDVTDF